MEKCVIDFIDYKVEFYSFGDLLHLVYSGFVPNKRMESAMNTLIAVTSRAMIGSIPFVGQRTGDKLRFVAGAGVNVAGASILLAETFKHACLTI